MDPVHDQAPSNPTGADAPTGETEPPASPGLPPPTSVESLVNALLEAGPEVAEHVVRAAQELLLAAQVVVDAAERAVDEQKDLRNQTGDAPPAATNVHPIDRNE
jgi:hypothetical protein